MGFLFRWHVLRCTVAGMLGNWGLVVLFVSSAGSFDVVDGVKFGCESCDDGGRVLILIVTCALLNVSIGILG